MSTVYNQIDENKNATTAVFFCFVLFLSFLGWFVGQLTDGGLVIFVIAFVFSVGSTFVSYYLSDSIVLAISGAREIDIKEHRYLYNLVENLCIASGLPIPKIYIINDTAMNAFATGRDPAHAALCFTSGIVDRLEKAELEGVIAHELSHVQNYDIRLMSIVTVLVGTTSLVADFFTRGMFYGSRRSSNSRDDNSIFLLLGIVLMILSPIIATLIKLAINRKREYLADASAVLMTRSTSGLIGALEKLASDNEILEAANGATAHMYISNPLKAGNGMSVMFSTHPPIEDRIQKLREM